MRFLKNATISISVFGLFVVAGCATGITRDNLLKQLQEGTAPLIVDVRSQCEYDRDHVPGALHIPFYAVRSGLKDAGVSRKAPLVLYCEHGPRAGIAGFLLFLSGYENVFSLEGSMKGWRKSEFPVEMVVHGNSTSTPDRDNKDEEKSIEPR